MSNSNHTNPANPVNYYLTHFSTHEAIAARVQQDWWKAAVAHENSDLFHLELYGA